eukprot:TRINITY_DN6361_c0_g5_i1.p1 TRINITY_DN6361_c0_g5~~TRINITY_DN6361_c0_g5_i1.p1  ORF type:complete len:621 (-),score=73.85 TRINITY_DN6361_c0_g5_i1:218-2080(-)
MRRLAYRLAERMVEDTDSHFSRPGSYTHSLWSNFTRLPLARRLFDLFDVADAKELIEFAAHKSGANVCASRWCITKEDLLDFAAQVRQAWMEGQIPQDPDHPNPYHDDPTIGPNIYAVCTHFIKPRTLEAGGVSWALMKHPQGLPCDVFVTHSWYEGVFEFVDKLEGLWPADAKHLYCCFLSNPQHGDISAMLGKSAVKSPFAVALATSRYLLVVPNCQQSIYTRLWCVFEAHLALQLGLQIRLPSRPRFHLLLVALLPRLLLSLVCGVLQFWYMHLQPDSLQVKAVRVLAAFVVFGSPCLPTTSCKGGGFVTWLPFIVLGCHCGVSVRTLMSFRSSPFWYALRVVVFLLILLTLLEQSLRGLASRVVANEGGQLEFESVQNASCSYAKDESTIRQALGGHEELLDAAIRTLRAVGYYDKDVSKALRLGIPAQRLRHGTGYGVIIVAAVMIVCGLFTPLCSAGILDRVSVYPLLALFAFLVASLLWFVFRICPEPRVLAFDSMMVLSMSMMLCEVGMNVYMTGHMFLHESKNRDCELVPWYFYPAVAVPHLLLWFLALGFLYKRGIRCFTEALMPDGVLVAGTYDFGTDSDCSSDEEGSEDTASRSSNEDSTRESTIAAI